MEHFSNKDIKKGNLVRYIVDILSMYKYLKNEALYFKEMAFDPQDCVCLPLPYSYRCQNIMKYT